MACCSWVVAGSAGAQEPPQPDFFWTYGRVLDGTANIAPARQPIVAIVRGQACGAGLTSLAEAGPDVPAADVGKTVYVVDVKAHGTGTGQRPGCGRPGDQVVFYLPAIQRLAQQTPAFKVGEQRTDLTLGPALSQRQVLPAVGSDGAP